MLSFSSLSLSLILWALLSMIVFFGGFLVSSLALLSAMIQRRLSALLILYLNHNFMLLIKTVVRSGMPVFELRRYNANFKGSVLLLQTVSYDKAVQAKDFFESLTDPSFLVSGSADPAQLSIDVPLVNSSKHGK